MGGARGILQNTAALAGAHVVERVGNVALTLLIARVLGADSLGVYAAAIAFYALIAIGGELGITSFLVREIAKDRDRTSLYVVHLGAVALLSGAALAGGTIVVVPFLGLSSELALGVSLILLAVPAGVANVLQEGVFLAFQRAELRALVIVGVAIANMAAGTVLLASGRGVVSVLLVFVILQYVGALASAALIRRSLVRLELRFSVSTARRLVGEMKAFVASSTLGALFARPEIVILALVASEAEIGYYSAALKMIDVWYFIPATFCMNVYPVLSHAHHAADSRFLVIQAHALRFLMTVSLPIAVVTLIVSGPLVEFLYGDGFGDAVGPLRILAATVCLYGLFELFWRVLSARDQHGEVVRVQVITTATRLGGGVGLSIPFGALGAAISSVANLSLHVGLLAARIRRNGAPLGLVTAVRPAVAAAAAGVVAWLTLPILDLYGAIPCAFVGYLVVAWKLGALSRDDFALMLRRGATEA